MYGLSYSYRQYLRCVQLPRATERARPRPCSPVRTCPKKDTARLCGFPGIAVDRWGPGQPAMAAPPFVSVIGVAIIIHTRGRRAPGGSSGGVPSGSHAYENLFTWASGVLAEKYSYACWRMGGSSIYEQCEYIRRTLHDVCGGTVSTMGTVSTAAGVLSSTCSVQRRTSEFQVDPCCLPTSFGFLNFDRERVGPFLI